MQGISGPSPKRCGKQNPQAAIVIAADDDHKLEANPRIGKNVGRVKAEEAAQAIGGRTISPPLNQAEKDKGLSDFDDLESARGKQAFAGLVGDLLEKSRPMQRQRDEPRKIARTFAVLGEGWCTGPRSITVLDRRKRRRERS